MEKINVAELLRNCPSGMKLDCTLVENLYFDCINDSELDDPYPIQCYTQNGAYRTSIRFNEYGHYTLIDNSKCVIFPVGKTTWEGFKRPFKEGDILYVDCTDESDDEQHEYIFILNRIYNGEVHSYCHYYMLHDSFHSETAYLTDNKYPIRFASEEEKAQLFQAIKDNGYKWNAETKILEKLLKFKVGDKIIPKDSINKSRVINAILDNEYNLFGGGKIPFSDQDNYELVPNNFDITTLVPFESRVLVRDNIKEKWHPGIWGYYDSDCQDYPYKLIGDISRYCIPYEGNEHLLGTTNDCDEFYKTWN